MRCIDDLDPVTDGVRMFEIQRENWSFGDDTLPGGFLQLMSLSGDGIVKTSIVHRWHEELERDGVPAVARYFRRGVGNRSAGLRAVTPAAPAS